MLALKYKSLIPLIIFTNQKKQLYMDIKKIFKARNDKNCNRVIQTTN